MTRSGALLALALAVSTASAAEGRVHVVQPGETLWKIAERLAGDADRWPELYRANRDQIKDPGVLYPGQRLAVPEFPEGARAEVPPPVSGPPPESVPPPESGPPPESVSGPPPMSGLPPH